MRERRAFLEEITRISADYRLGQVPPITPDHVNRWVSQFDPDDQLVILAEMARILGKHYVSQRKASRFIEKVLAQEEICGADPISGLRNTRFLEIQRHGSSQNELVALTDQVLKKNYGLRTFLCGSFPKAYIYIDDCLVTGYTILHDLEGWLPKAVPGSRLHIILFSVDKGKKDYVWKRLKVLARVRDVKAKIWTQHEFQRMEYMWPQWFSGDARVDLYVEEVYRRGREQGLNLQLFRPDIPPGTELTFSSPEARKIVERAFMAAGAYIVSLPKQPKPEMRPMGYAKLESLGSGAVTVTYRNCPNNCPLALWWGDPDKPRGNPLSKWYPLFKRKQSENNLYTFR